MVYLSANGELIGQFEENDIPSLLADGKIGLDAFYWREGLTQWRPLREMVLTPRPAEPKPLRAGASAAERPPAAPPPAIASSKAAPRGNKPGKELAAMAGRDEVPRKDLSHPAPAVASASAKPAPPAATPATAATPVISQRPDVRKPRLGPHVSGSVPAAAPESAGGAARCDDTAATAASTVPRADGRRGRFFARLAGLMLAAAGLAALWWFFFNNPPVLTGEVRWLGADGRPAPVAGAEVLLVPRQELAARWRGQLAEVRQRAAETEQMLVQARTAQREKFLAFELAARTSELGDEYNMPDAAELRAARDAAQAEEAEASALVDRLTREKEIAAGPAAFLKTTPDAVARTRTDGKGGFRLSMPAVAVDMVVLVVSRPVDETNAAQGWLVPLTGQEKRRGPVLLSPDDALDSVQIAEMAGTPPPASGEN